MPNIMEYILYQSVKSLSGNNEILNELFAGKVKTHHEMGGLYVLFVCLVLHTMFKCVRTSRDNKQDLKLQYQSYSGKSPFIDKTV